MSHNSTDRSEFRFGKESKNVNFDRDYPDGERRALFRQYEFAHARQHLEPPENDEWNRDRSHINQDIRTSVQPARDSNRTGILLVFTHIGHIHTSMKNNILFCRFYFLKQSIL